MWGETLPSQGEALNLHQALHLQAFKASVRRGDFFFFLLLRGDGPRGAMTT